MWDGIQSIATSSDDCVETALSMQQMTGASAIAVPASSGVAKSLWGDAQQLQTGVELLQEDAVVARDASREGSVKEEAGALLRACVVRQGAVLLAAVGSTPQARLLRRGIAETTAALLVRAGHQSPESIGTGVPWRNIPVLPSLKLHRGKLVRDICSLLAQGDLAHCLAFG